ncbi:MAG: hypothetical protein GDA56_27550 [Hormoscilla sp. GM7CHS1pb]|nr:hypothetical protein [Hormoscilla sp. GM7CHS1pb]
MNMADMELFERQRMTDLKNRLFSHERGMQSERHRLWLSEKDANEEYPVWEQLERLSAVILGYVSQITSTGYTVQPAREVVEHLHSLSSFEVESVVKWYYTAASDYPKIQQYFELLDYLRLLALSYVERHQLEKL